MTYLQVEVDLLAWLLFSLALLARHKFVKFSQRLSLSCVVLLAEIVYEVRLAFAPRFCSSEISICRSEI
jgi:hypothetical protein